MRIRTHVNALETVICNFFGRVLKIFARGAHLFFWDAQLFEKKYLALVRNTPSSRPLPQSSGRLNYRLFQSKERHADLKLERKPLLEDVYEVFQPWLMRLHIHRMLSLRCKR